MLHSDIGDVGWKQLTTIAAGELNVEWYRLAPSQVRT